MPNPLPVPPADVRPVARALSLCASALLTALLAAGCAGGGDGGDGATAGDGTGSNGADTGGTGGTDSDGGFGSMDDDLVPIRRTLLFVGDSITAGVCDGFRYTYREPLLERLAEDGFDVDAIGSRTSAEYPGDCFLFPDGEHVSYPGARTENLALELANDIDSFEAPDIAIVFSGVNDLHALDSPQQIVAELQDIVDVIEARNPAARVYVAALPPNRSWGPGVPALNAEIKVMFETEPNVTIIDLNPVFVLGTHDSDGLHPNELGARVIADTIRATFIADGALVTVPEGASPGLPLVRP